VVGWVDSSLSSRAALVERCGFRLLCSQRGRPPPRRVPGSTARAGQSAPCSSGRSRTRSSTSSASAGSSASSPPTATCAGRSRPWP